MKGTGTVPGSGRKVALNRSNQVSLTGRSIFIVLVCSNARQLQNLYGMSSGLHQRCVLCNLIFLPELPNQCQRPDLLLIFISQGTSPHPDKQIQITAPFRICYRDLSQTLLRHICGWVLMMWLFQEAGVYFGD